MKMFFRRLTALSFAFIAVLSTPASNWKWDYEIEGAGTGVQDTYLIKTTVVSKKPTLDDVVFLRCAIHGVLFRGFESKQYRQSQKPIIKDEQTEQDHKDYLDSFFNGDLTSFAQIVDGTRTMMMKDKKYHITLTIQVYKELLRHKLEDDGIIKRLNDYFE